jgi:hypothetical protein
MEIVDKRKLGKPLPEVAEESESNNVLKFEEMRKIGEPEQLYRGIPRTKHEWKDVAFMIAFLNINGNQTISGRALGLRDDGRAFFADYLFTPVWEEGFDWTAVAKDRLDTFLNCGCQDGAACEMHEKTVQSWLVEGVNRIQAIGSQGVPPAVEAFMKAQQQQPRIIHPGR